MLALVHRSAAIAAFLMLLTFWTSTIAVEVFGSETAIATAKTAILYAMGLLLPLMVATGVSGGRLARGMRGPAVARKMLRMKIVAANGALILIPSAVFLYLRATAGQFDTGFLAVQGLELLTGAVNITLMALNIRAGRSLRRPQGLRTP